MFPHEDLRKLRHLRVSENIMQRIFSATARYYPPDQPGWIREEPMRGLFGLKTLVVKRELDEWSPTQKRYACRWGIVGGMNGPRRRNAPWKNVFEYLGEGAWPIVSTEGHLEWSNYKYLYGFCCRPDPVSTLNSLRKLRRPYFLY